MQCLLHHREIPVLDYKDLSSRLTLKFTKQVGSYLVWDTIQTLQKHFTRQSLAMLSCPNYGAK